jgi:hypothetical protein
MPAAGTPGAVASAASARAVDETAAVAAVEPTDSACVFSSDALVRADEVMKNQYRLGTWPAFTLPSDLRWTENPPGDANWAFQFHAMRYVLDLLSATRLTGNMAYQDRGLALLLDWTRDNPPLSPPSIWSWSDHSTALRAIVLACTADATPMTSWLRTTLVTHGEKLADPSFYRKEGNHALNQDLGLLEVARVLDRADWQRLAVDRINTLISTSIDPQGVTNEQSVGYQFYNYRRYTQAAERITAVGLTPGSEFSRLELMPEFLAHATLPNGKLEMIGDTSGDHGASILGTVAEYAATSGASGPKPTRTIARYDAGYLFARTGWGERRAATDETFWSLRWGPGPVFHGHPDGLSLTLAGYGSRLLLDTGLYSYTWSPYRSFFKHREGHNVVTVDGATWDNTAATRLLDFQKSTRYIDVRLRASGYPGVTHTRRVTYSRRLDYLLIDDRLASSSVHTYRQLWHLAEDSQPAIEGSSVRTQRTTGNVLIRQLAGTPTLRIIKGRTDPVQGWVSYSYGTKVAAPVEEAIQKGKHVRYLTLIVPSSGKAAVKVSQVSLTNGGYSVTIRIGERSERVTVSGNLVWMRPLAERG